MSDGKHGIQGALTGNPTQPQGRHEIGIGLIPLGSRTRVAGDQIHQLFIESEENSKGDRFDKLIDRFL